MMQKSHSELFFHCDSTVICLETQVLEMDYLGSNPFTYCVTLGKLQNLSMSGVLPVN